MPSQDRLLILTGLHGLLNLGTMLPFLDVVLQGRLAQQRPRDLLSVQAEKVDSKFNLATVTQCTTGRLCLLCSQVLLESQKINLWSLGLNCLFYGEKKATEQNY